MPKKEAKAPTWSDTKLSAADQATVAAVRTRIEELKTARRELYGDLENVWRDADSEYVPHRTGMGRGKRVIATDEERGWRGTLTELTSSKAWRSDVAFPNPYIKIQSALGILVDQNPVGVFFPSAKKYLATTELIKQLYQRSWDVAKSKQQLKLFLFNLSKYGWAIARTYPLKVTRTSRVLTEPNEDDPSKNVYETKEVVVYNDLMRENLDVWNAWIDDMAKPSNQFSMRDWAWRKVYPMDAFKEEFGRYPNAKFVTPGGIVTPRIDTAPQKGQSEFKSKDLVEVYFYENVLRDEFVVMANGVPVIVEPLPISDSEGSKKLSCWHTFWNVRDAQCPYGIGIYEAIRHDSRLLDAVRNMTVDQLKLSVMKMFFYQGTQALTETGDMEIEPGKGRQVLDPKAINWLEVPGPGAEAWSGLEKIQDDIDTTSGITPPILGEITGKTAFELAQAKESALKRLKTPLDNVTDALGAEADITVALMQLLYSMPEIIAVSDPALIDDYLKEVDGDPELYDRDEEGVFQAKVYREFPLQVEQDEEGNLIEAKDNRFFRVKPRHLSWNGTVNVKPQSVLSPSKQVDKALELEMYDRLQAIMASNDPATYSKMAKSVVKLYDKDPRDILPPMWLQEGPMAPEAMGGMSPEEEPLFVPNGEQTGGQEQLFVPQQPQPESSPAIPNPTGLASNVANKISGMFR